MCVVLVFKYVFDMEEIVSSRSDVNCSKSTVCVDKIDQARSSDNLVETETVGHSITLSPYGKGLTGGYRSLHSESDVGQKSNDDYYEVISADGSIGGDDEDDFHENNNVTDNSGNSALPNKQCSIVDLPFVPKFEFVDESNLDGRNSPPNVPSSSGALRVNKFRPGYTYSHMPSRSSNFSMPPQIDLGQLGQPPPSLNLSIPPPPLPNLATPPPSLFSESFLNKQFSGVDLETEQISPSQLPASHSVTNYSGIPRSTNIQNTTSTFTLDDSSSSISNSLASQCGSQQTSHKIKKAVSDWVDENGDPLPGAFDVDVVHSSNEDVSVDDDSNTKVEYVFSVREKKYEPHVSAFSLMNSNVSLQNAAGNLGFSLGNKLAPTVPSDIASYDAEEEKKLYEASKTGAEYKAAIESSSASTDPGSTTQKITENENAKNERFNRFKRNRFTDRKDDEPGVDSKEEPPKTQAEQALESQAVTEILKEVQRGAIRAREQGALGWQKCPVPVTNKTFLRNTLVSTLREPYKPPNKRGRFHVGLQRDNNSQRQDYEYDDDSSSRSSRSSRSRSSSRSRRSYSYSSRSSSRSGDGRRDSSQKGRDFQRGSWPGSQDEYYDWAAYAAQYGYQWYGPEAYGMYYGGEGWPMEAYAAMYYGDPQAWADYEAYYGPQNFNGRGRGRGMRGRGRGGRFRGRGSFPDNFRGYDRDLRSRSRDFSRSLSRDRSERSRSYSQGPSGRVRSPGSRTRSETRSLSHSRKRTRDVEILKEDGSDDNRSVSGSAEKKKKKKKKKKHRKSKKSKHKSKHREEENEKETGGKEKIEGMQRENEEDESGIKAKKEIKKKHRKEKDRDTKGKHSRHKSTEKRTRDTKSKRDGTNEEGLEDVSKEESKRQKSQRDSYLTEGSGEKTEHVDDKGEEQVRKVKRQEHIKRRKECSDDQLSRSREPEQGKEAKCDKDSEIQREKLIEDRTSNKTSSRSSTTKGIDTKLAKINQSSRSKNKVENKSDMEDDKQKNVRDKEDCNVRREKDARSLNRLNNKSDDLKHFGKTEKGTISGSHDSEGNKEDKKSITERDRKGGNAAGTSRDVDNFREKEDVNREKYDGKDKKQDVSSKMKEKGRRRDGDSVQVKKSHDPSSSKSGHESGKYQKSKEKGKEQRSWTGQNERGEKLRNANQTMEKNVSHEAASNDKVKERGQKEKEEDVIRSESVKKMSDKNKKSHENIKKNRVSDAATTNDRLSSRITDGREDTTVSAEKKGTRKSEEEMREMPINSEMPKEQVFSSSSKISDGKTGKGSDHLETMKNCKSKESEMDQAKKDVDNNSDSSFKKVPNNERRNSNINLEVDGQGNVSEVSEIIKVKKKIVKRKSDVQAKIKKIKPSDDGDASFSKQITDQSAGAGDPGATVKRKKKISKLKCEETSPGKKRKMQEETETVEVKTDGL